MHIRVRSLASITVPLACSLTLYVLAPFNSATAQIIPDGTLGAQSSIVTPNVNIKGIPSDLITGGAVRGTNLFHSFSEFNVGAGRGAYFDNRAGIANIFSRTTGISPSNIFGTLGVLGNANLFLINPRGMIFGPNARLDMGGSFVGSTASAIQFPDGSEFSALDPQAPPLLSINIPIGLQFRGNAGDILVQGSSLRVPEGQTLALVGGNVSLDNALLQVPGGRIELGGVAGLGTVGLLSDGNNLRLSFPAGVVRSDVSLTNGAEVIVVAEGGGSISINAQNLNIARKSGFLAGIAPGSSSSSAAGDIEINATEAINLTNESTIFNLVFPGSAGKGGNINITTRRLTLSNGSVIATSTRSSGNGGNLVVNASDSVQVIGRTPDGESFSGLITQTGGTGNAGNIEITTGQLLVSGGAQVTAITGGEGKGGDLIINASDSVQVLGTTPDGRSSSALGTQAQRVGDAGNLKITTRQLIISNGAQVGANTPSPVGSGKGGNVIINASDSVQLIGTAPNGSPSVLITLTTNTGDAGNIEITTKELLVSGGAQIATTTSGAGNGGKLIVNASDSVQVIGTSADGEWLSRLSVDTEGTGKAGNLEITTRQLFISNGGQVTAGTFGSGNGGNLIVNASDSVQVIGTAVDSRFASGLFTETENTGKAGNIEIITGQLLIAGGAVVSASTSGSGDGGNLIVNASQGVQVTGTSADSRFPSALIAEATSDSTGSGGSINISTNNLNVSNRAEISTRSRGSGKAGDITIDTNALNLNNGRISATATRSNAGNINVSASSIRLDNTATINANTAGEQGNINLNSESLVLRRGSNITTNARGDNVIGGNITINTAVLAALENSDISADSANFRGGNVNITAQGIFGTAFRPVQTPNSDITATGADSSLNGNVTINRFGIDPTTGLIVLPENLIDPATLIAQNPCERGKGSAFVITGRGGLPANPGEPLNSDAVRVGLVEPASSLTSQEQTQTTQPNASQIQHPIVPAQGWVFNDKGEVVLTAYNPTNTQTQRPWVNTAACPSQKI